MSNLQGFDISEIGSDIHSDHRGYFREWTNPEVLEMIPDFHAIQTNIARSRKNVVRGLHTSLEGFQQQKLVTCVFGTILDVLVDLRKDSETLGKVFTVELSESNAKSIFIPRGLAHGYSVLSDAAVVIYQVDNRFNPQTEIQIQPFDEGLGIDWRLTAEPVISQKDISGLTFSEYIERYHR